MQFSVTCRKATMCSPPRHWETHVVGSNLLVVPVHLPLLWSATRCSCLGSQFWTTQQPTAKCRRGRGAYWSSGFDLQWIWLDEANWLHASGTLSTHSRHQKSSPVAQSQPKLRQLWSLLTPTSSWTPTKPGPRDPAARIRLKPDRTIARADPQSLPCKR